MISTQTFDVIVMNTGAAIPNIWRKSLSEGMDTDNALKPDFLRVSIIIKAATTW